MKTTRKIIEIDEEKCNGCGLCILACAEGALEIVDGKAKLVGEIYCDGFGACLGDCPEGALKIIEREADEFNEEAVEELLKSKAESESTEPQQPLACGCPGSMIQSLQPENQTNQNIVSDEIGSELGHWPIKLQLLGPHAPFLKDADLILMADCAAASYPDLHRRFLKGNTIALGCPKLDNLDAHISRLAEILKGANPRSLTVLHMQVPCCSGFVYAGEKAIEQSGVSLPFKRIMIGINGEILEQVDMN